MSFDHDFWIPACAGMTDVRPICGFRAALDPPVRGDDSEVHDAIER